MGQRVSLQELAVAIETEVVGGPEAAAGHVSACNTLEGAGEGEITFLSNPKYAKQLATTRATAAIVPASFKLEARPGLVLLKSKDPYHSFMLAAVRLHGYRRHPHSGIHPAAHIDPSAHVGEGATIYPGVYVGPRSRIGRDCILYPNVVIYDDTVVGDRVILHAGCVIGIDGFGHATHKDADGVHRHYKIPQVGNVVVEDDVEIGANTSICRGSLNTTLIGRGTKIDCNVAIGHGTRIGEHGLIVAQVGIAGSVTVGHHATMAGQVGIAGHLKIGNGVILAAQTGVMADVPDQTVLMGSPGMPVTLARRVYAIFRQLPELLERVRKLERATDDAVPGQAD